MTQLVPVLAWTATPVAPGPIASYPVTFTTETVWQFGALYGSFGSVDVRPNFVTIDNYNNDQIILVSFGAIPFPVGSFQRLTVPVPSAATQMTVEAQGGTSTITVMFAVNDLSRSDGVNFKGISASAQAGSILEPIDYIGTPANANVNIASVDLGRMKVFSITAAGNINLPVGAVVGNGFRFRAYNLLGSSTGANQTIIAAGGETITLLDGTQVSSVVMRPGICFALTCDGGAPATWFLSTFPSRAILSATLTAAQVIPTGVITKIALDSIGPDDKNFNTALNRWSPGRGVFLITGVVLVTTIANARTEIYVRRNGLFFAYQGYMAPNALNAEVTFSFIVLGTAETDYFELFLFQNSGVNQSIFAGGGNTLFTMMRLS